MDNYTLFYDMVTVDVFWEFLDKTGLYMRVCLCTMPWIAWGPGLSSGPSLATRLP